jgi:uncharacterized membrane protein
MFRSTEKSRKTADAATIYYDPVRVMLVVNTIIALMVLLLLAAPILSLYKLSLRKTEEATYAAIGVLMAFTLAFAATMSMITHAKRHETFAASAAYCAVLVVFISSQNN